MLILCMLHSNVVHINQFDPIFWFKMLVCNSREQIVHHAMVNHIDLARLWSFDLCIFCVWGNWLSEASIRKTVDVRSIFILRNHLQFCWSQAYEVLINMTMLYAYGFTNSLLDTCANEICRYADMHTNVCSHTKTRIIFMYVCMYVCICVCVCMYEWVRLYAKIQKPCQNIWEHQTLVLENFVIYLDAHHVDTCDLKHFTYA